MASLKDTGRYSWLSRTVSFIPPFDQHIALESENSCITIWYVGIEPFYRSMKAVLNRDCLECRRYGSHKFSLLKILVLADFRPPWK